MVSEVCRVSIVIPCKEIDNYARESIEHCLALDYPDFEILLLPDSEPEFHHPQVKVLPTGAMGPAEKRDLATNHASGEILAFIDDDAYPAVHWLKEAVKHFVHDEVAAVGGPAVTPPSDGLLQKASGLVYSSFLSSGSLRARYTPRKQREVEDHPSCNFIIKKSVFQQLGGFSTFFWPGEDTKLCLEITNKLRKKIIYDPKVLVYHHRRKLFIPHLKQLWGYSVHRGYFAKKFPQTSFKPSYLLPSLFCLGLLFGSVASLFNPVVKLIFLSALGVYLLLALLSSLQSKEIEAIPLVFLGIIFTHLTYGIGFIRGLLTWRLAR